MLILIARSTNEKQHSLQLIEKYLPKANVIFQPIIQVEPVAVDDTKLLKLANQEHAAIIVTSKNGMRFLSQATIDAINNVPLFLVGNSLFDKVKSMGFNNIIRVENNANDLFSFIIGEPKKRLFTYIRGMNISFSFSQKLSEYDIACHDIITYNVMEKQVNFDATFSDMRKNGIAELHIPIFSRNMGGYISKQLNNYDYQDLQINFWLLSDNCTQKIEQKQNHKFFFASKPNFDNLLQKMLSTYKTDRKN